MQFNPAKCHLIAFGRLASKKLATLFLGGNRIEWMQSIKYLGVHIVSGKCFAIDIKPIKRCFFTAYNTVSSQSWRMDNILQLSLLESYCLPILTYAAAAVSFKVRQLAEPNACWNSVYRKIFGFNRWESVKVFIQGLGRLDLTHICMLRKCNWLCTNRRCANPVFSNLLWISLSECKDVNKF